VQSAVPHRLFDRLTLGLVVIVLAVPLTMLEVTHPSLQTLRSGVQTWANPLSPSTPAPKPATQATPKPKPATKPAPAAAATPTPAPNPAVAANTATTSSFVHLRAAKSTSSAIITDLNGGTVVELREDADATWQGVTYQGKTGYIYRAYLQYQPAASKP
jgi:hypothetical protein